jgi:F-type H+-transporting ATPase subunit b
MLLSPDFGLLFWMMLSFSIVFFILAKFGFPVITKSVAERASYIHDSLEAAKKANEKVVSIKQECDELVASARAEQVKILREAADTRDRIISEARNQAKTEGMKELQVFKQQLQSEKEQAMRDLRLQMAELSVGVAEKILRSSLGSEKAQLDLIGRLVDEALVSKS